MENKKSGKKAVVGIAMAAIMLASIFAMIAPAFGFRDVPVPAGDAGIYFLDPKDNGAPESQTKTIDAWVNSSGNIDGGKVTLVTSDKTCANITSCLYNSTEWDQFGTNVVKEGGRRAVVTFGSNAEKTPGNYYVGTITVECNSSTYCIANLNFTLGPGVGYITNISGIFNNVAGENGTFAYEMPAPDIISFLPTSPASDYKDASRTFNITIDQPVNVTWLINGSDVKDSEKNVAEANYTNTSAKVGTWNVSAVVENANGTDIQMWIWNVIEPEVAINEFVAKPNITQTSEWIELYNPTGGDVALNGWTIEDNTGSTYGLGSGDTALDGKTVPANGYLVLNKSGGDFGFALNDGGDVIILKNATKEVDRVEYGDGADIPEPTGDNAPAPDEDNSTGRFPNGVDTDNDSADFRVFDTPTPGATNTEAGAVPTADSLGVEDTGGSSGTYVVVPVNITNVMNGPIPSIRLRVDYNESVLNMTTISKGDLTSVWTQLQLGVDGHTMVIATGQSGDAIPVGSTGPVVLLNFSVIGLPGDTSPMNMTLIELSNLGGTEVGTAPAKNGTFVVSSFSSIVGRVTYACNGTGIAGVNVNLTNESIINTTVTNETGYYNFTDVIPDGYFVNASKPKFWANSTEVTVIAGATTTADMTLWLKGDLNNNCNVADAGDVVLMLRASVGDISGDAHYDLNENDIIADAGDVVQMLRASVGDIELL